MKKLVDYYPFRFAPEVKYSISNKTYRQDAALSHLQPRLGVQKKEKEKRKEKFFMFCKKDEIKEIGRNSFARITLYYNSLCFFPLKILLGYLTVL